MNATPAPLSTALSEALARFAAQPRVLIALDFDGTLAPEVDDPNAARALPSIHQSLLRLATLPETTVALVSGRSLQSLRQVSQMPPHVPLVGSHGLELQFDAGDIRAVVTEADRARVAALRSRLSPLVAAATEAWIEDKPAGFAVHTRLVDMNTASAVNHDARAEALRFDPAFTVREGKNVIEFAVRSETKGDGIRALRTRFSPSALLFAGDDVTDEDAFAVLEPDDIGIKVGGADTRANHRIADPEAMAGMLQTLLRLRAPSHLVLGNP